MFGDQSSDKTGVLVQWLTNEYLVNFGKKLGGMTVGPDEYIIVMKGGEIEEIVTQAEVATAPGLLRRIIEKLTGSPDRQMVIVDTRKHNMDVGFEAYTSDRVPIRGVVNLFANISKSDVELCIRLLKEPGDFGRMYHNPWVREFTIDDLRKLLERNIGYVIDTESVSMYASSEIQANRREICMDVVAALNAKTPYWANYGLTVTYSSVEISDNEYERLERLDRENRLKQRQRDIDYADSVGDSEQRIRIHDIAYREEAADKLNDYIAGVNLEAAKVTRVMEIEHERALRTTGFREEEYTRDAEMRNRLQMMSLYHQQEVARVKGDSEMSEAEKDERVAEIQLRIADINGRIHRLEVEAEAYAEDVRNRQRREQSRFETELELERKAKEADILLRLSEREDALRSKTQDHRHAESMASIEGDVAKAKYAADGEIAAARAELKGFKDANELSHKQNLDNAAMNERIIRAASGGRATDHIVCPRCGMSLDPRARFCGGCGAKLQEE